MDLHHWFLPHRTTHKKAHLISWEALIIYLLVFILIQVSFSVISYLKPGVLGINTTIDYKKIIELTNNERQKNGLEPLVENASLNNAAVAKANNMFSENYWAHFAPSGKTPWDFIVGSGYKFTYAGENLAKNFYSPEEVVAAWMASPTHRENLLSPKYKDIGIAVVDGLLNGQKTTLVVQMFGNTSVLPALPAPKAPEINLNGQNINLSKSDYEKPFQILPVKIENIPAKALVDPFQLSKMLGLGLTGMILTLLTVDYLALRKRGVIRIGSHHFAHMIVLVSLAVTLFLLSPGGIL